MKLYIIVGSLIQEPSWDYIKNIKIWIINWKKKISRRKVLMHNSDQQRVCQAIKAWLYSTPESIGFIVSHAEILKKNIFV